MGNLSTCQWLSLAMQKRNHDVKYSSSCFKSSTKPLIFSQHGVFDSEQGPRINGNTYMHGIFFHWPFAIGQLSRPLEDSWSLRPRYLSTPEKKEPLEPPRATNLHLFWTSVFSVSFRHFMSFHVLPMIFYSSM